MMIATLAILLSAALLGVLGWRDPKRLRTAHAPRIDGALSPRMRAAIGGLALAPGLALAAGGAWHAFLIWLGAACTAGWATAQVLARRKENSS